MTYTLGMSRLEIRANKFTLSLNQNKPKHQNTFQNAEHELENFLKVYLRRFEYDFFLSDLGSQLLVP